ncbi:membrane fusion protein, heavy metal efflux system [Methylococcus capsulatus]|jgi:cobalt-zinc-cadmium efflux system membrane fusion protein|uniref:Membrane fusion protein, heavy metal efflux system n=1 Tax=Methylococcus capsulatus TaxID=414 RepID=A0AA35XYI1_METCP|nr:efflux RND transporter periplasmic adaptor subunit [Methylococcus capsulatus]CAI8814872.1 membrane fusion protein, heavy metal efflux system [Methylococcus capsulatus]
MKLALFPAVMSLLTAPALAADTLVKMDAQQIEHLDVRVAKPEIVNALPLAWAPARVVIPPDREFIVSAPQAGVITRIDVALGSSVAPGQVVAEMQSPDLLTLQRDLLNAATEYELAGSKLNRDQKLLDEGVISKLRWQETRSTFDKAQANLRQAEQVLDASGMSAKDIAELKRTRSISNTLLLRTPIRGVLLERLATVGQRVSMLAPLFRIGNVDQLWLEIDMPQERLSEIRLKDRVELDSPRIRATIIEVSQNVRPDSQTALVRAVIDEHDDSVRAGQNVNVQVMHASTDFICRVPLAAIISQDGRQYVFVRTSDGFAVRPVKVAAVDGRQAIIHEGLTADDRVAVQGVAALKGAWTGLGGGDE